VGAIVSAVNNRGTCKFLPVIDGSLIQDLPSRLIESGKILPVNFIGGHTTGKYLSFCETFTAKIMVNR
jgi:hypothetical protein